MKHWSLLHYRAEQRKRVDHAVGASLLFVLIISIGLTWRTIDQIGGSIERKRTAMIERREQELSRAAIVDRICSVGGRVTERAASIVEQNAALPTSLLLADIANALPPGSVLTSLSIARDGSGSLSIFGRSAQKRDVKEFVNRLDENANLRSVRLVNASDNAFTIECKPVTWNASVENSDTLGKTVAIELAPLP